MADLFDKIHLFPPLHDVLLPPTRPPHLACWDSDQSLSTIHPLLPNPGRCTYLSTADSPGWPAFDGTSVSPASTTRSSPTPFFIPSQEHELLMTPLPEGGEIVPYGFRRVPTPPDAAVDDHHLTKHAVAFLGIGAAWRTMLVMQPPATGPLRYSTLSTGTMFRPRLPSPSVAAIGVTCGGGIVDAYRAHWTQCPMCPLRNPSEWTCAVARSGWKSAESHGGRDGGGLGAGHPRTRALMLLPPRRGGTKGGRRRRGMAETDEMKEGPERGLEMRIGGSPSPKNRPVYIFV